MPCSRRNSAPATGTRESPPCRQHKPIAGDFWLGKPRSSSKALIHWQLEFISIRSKIMATEAKCPVAHGAIRAHTNRDWWPNQLNLQVLHQNSGLSNPMGEEF